jgi:Protein of unknown function (DUF1592)/Protein of unknown function (DUF1588)/Protein of unknown function (DUF1587)/Protein of unknown function (DUF1585)/Protein of unknown function (DUF1595)/Planctomycete cytochrome C
MNPRQLSIVSVILLMMTYAENSVAAEPADRQFIDLVQPFLQRYCHACHGAKKQESKLDLSLYNSAASVARNERIWGAVMERLEAEEMPPAKATKKPSAHERRAVLDWLREFREQEANRNAGDPGRVLARRLNNAEFDYTIRDLTGVDIRPTREFPVDPANEAGFDNSGESLNMSPALLKKYLAATRFVTDHAVLTADGFVFAPHPVVTDTDRDKYCVERVIAFYDRHRVDYADYFLAAWRFQNRKLLGKEQMTLRDFADEGKLSPKYLATIWRILTGSPAASGPLAELQAQWRKLPSDVQKPVEIRKDCERLRDLVIRLRKDLTPKPESLEAKGISKGSQPFVLWRNRQIAGQHLRGNGKPDSADFCRVFPDAFAITERAPYYDAGSSPKGRLLSAGFHLMHGWFRDDGPLYELVLDDAARREIDTLWDELHFVTLDPMRQYKDFIFFERAEPPRFMIESAFDFARSEDKDATSEAKINQLREAYLAKASKLGGSKQGLEAIEAYFRTVNAQIRAVEKARLSAEPSHLAALQTFAERAYRRPLSPSERDELSKFYRKLRNKDQLSHEEAIRDSLASILLSPQFCYRFDLPTTGSKAAPLSDYSLASRLSYFLWSSIPDAELLAHANQGDLHKPEVLVGQTHRMLRDPKIRGLAEQFAGNWLEFRRFEESNTVDRPRFPSFTNELRAAMAEEPIRFFLHVVQENRPVLDFVDADYAIVNPLLAKHYGMPIPARGADQWTRIDHARQYDRGGLLPMAVFLTKNSPGLRTSPVKRGYWVVRRMLGEHVPAPPPEVPELPKDEAKLGELSLPQLLARHRADKACAGCHQRFDSIGLAFEGFGPIGERRTKDFGGRPVEATATYPDGGERSGLVGLRSYVSDKRKNDFLDNLCRKLFAYALGRSLTMSDKPTIDAMRGRLEKDGCRFDSLIKSIITSPQFLNKRGRDDERE